MVLDLFAKYGWVIPLKDKKGETVTEAFKTIFKVSVKENEVPTEKNSNRASIVATKASYISN